MGEWYYIGHYGQLGPLTRDQLVELIDAEVIERETYVWQVGMSDWVVAGKHTELTTCFKTQAPAFDPPPPPMPLALEPAPETRTDMSRAPVYSNYPSPQFSFKSDRNRIVAGILQLVIPGVGRMYLGYSAIGVLQLVTSLCGIGAIWSQIDGIIMLCGGVKFDGYGRRLGR